MFSVFAADGDQINKQKIIMHGRNTFNLVYYMWRSDNPYENQNLNIPKIENVNKQNVH